MMNVVVVNDHADVRGGADRVAIDSAIAAAQSGANVFFFAGGGSESPQLKQNHIEVLNLHQQDVVERQNKIFGALAGLWNTSAAKSLLALLGTFSKTDTVVHVHSWTHVLSASIFSSIQKLGFKVLITAHDYFLACPNGAFYDYVKGRSCDCVCDIESCPSISCDKRNTLQKKYRVLRQGITKRALRSISLNVAFVSQFQAEILKHHLAPDTRTFILENPINVVAVPPAGEDRQKAPSLLFVGRLDREKGIELFCRAASRLRYEAVVIGDGPLKGQLSEKYPWIKFVGWKQLDEMGEYVKDNSLFVFPSLLFECSPLVVREMQYNFGLPCIVPEQGAAREFIEDGVNGGYFMSGNEDSLINSISDICKPSKFSGIVEKSRSKISDYDPQKYYLDLKQIYEELINE